MNANLYKKERKKQIYIIPLVSFETIDNCEVICCSHGCITATAPDMESGQPCGCDCPCDALPPGSCHCQGCSPNDPCVFFDGPCI